MAGAVSRGRRRAERPAFLPPAVSAGLRRAAAALVGLVLVLAAAALIVALVTHDPGDPSLDHAVDGAARNLLGVPGAYAADLLLQSIGGSAGLLVLALAAWGARLLFGRPLTRPWLRLALLPIVLALAMIALAAVTPPQGWSLSVGLGGQAGMLLLAGAGRGLTALGVAGVAAWVPAVAALVVGLALLPAVLAVTYRALGRGSLAAGRFFWQALRFGLGRRRNAALRPRRGKTRAEPSLAPATTGDGDYDGATLAAKTDVYPPPPEFLVAPRRGRAKPGRRAEAGRQRRLDLGDRDEEYELPALDLLAGAARQGEKIVVEEEALAQNARLLESVLGDFGVKGDIVAVRPGPVVTLYELVPAPGTKSARIIGLSDDIARSMSATSVRAAVISGRNAIGIELPNTRREMVILRELLESVEYERTAAKLPLVLGKDIGGVPVIADLARMPHLLIAGTTGSGKSVAINTMILSLLYRLRPDQCKFIMIDPKMLELSVYDGIPHLLTPVVTAPGKAVVALKWAVREMERRYQDMAKLGVRNVDGYNARITEARRKDETLTRTVQTGFDRETGAPIYEDRPFDLEPLPQLVIIVDEMADLMMVAGKDIEAAVQRLSQMARAAGIHLIMATQRPSVDVITGTIKANFPTRVSFQVTSKIDSRTILGEQGAETLLGQGDMLYMAGGGRITRVHGPFVSDREVEDVVRALKAQGAPSYIEAVTEEDESEPLPGFGVAEGGAEDELYRRAVELVGREGKASTSFVQRHLQIGYNRAARLIERMEADGLISAANHVGKREVLMGGGQG